MKPAEVAALAENLKLQAQMNKGRLPVVTSAELKKLTPSVRTALVNRLAS